MKLICQICLAFKEGSSDKVYEVDLCQTGDDQFVVNFRYGRRGHALQDGTKTVLPVSKIKAEKIFNDLINSKKKKGYYEINKNDPNYSSPPSSPSTPSRRSKKNWLREDRKRIILEELQTASSPGFMKKNKRSLERLIWRAGELHLKEAAPLLADLADKSTKSLTSYCIAWALGLCGDLSSIPTLKKMYGDAKNPTNNFPNTTTPRKFIIIEAIRALSPQTFENEILPELMMEMPMPLRELYNSMSPDQLRNGLLPFLKTAKEPDFYSIIIFYLINDERAREAVLHFIKEAPCEFNYYRQFRMLNKAAEFRGDGEIFGLTAYRLENEKAKLGFKPFFWYIKHYGKATYDYMRRRTWRTLKRLGTVGDENYVKMASGVLLAFSDNESLPSPERGMNGKNQETISYAYWPYLAFNHILFENSRRFKSWGFPTEFRNYKNNVKSGHPGTREEAFPELWDESPRELLYLISESQCSLVHEFAVTALRGNMNFCKSLEWNDLEMMLLCSYEVTNKLGCDLAQILWNPSSPDLFLVKAMLRSPFGDARVMASKWIESNLPFFLKEIEFLVFLCRISYEDIRLFARKWVTDKLIHPSLHGQTVYHLIDHMLMAADNVERDLKLGTGMETGLNLIHGIRELLLLNFRSVLRHLDISLIEQMVNHGLNEIKSFGGEILLEYDIKPDDLPSSLINKLLESDNEMVKSMGVRLLGLFPGDVLFAKQELLLGLCLSPFGEVRLQVHHILERLVSQNQAYGKLLARTLAIYLTGKEEHEGVFKDIAGLISEKLKFAWDGIDKELMFRLLNHGSLDSKGMGGDILLGVYSSSSFSVREVVRFLHNDLKRVRDFGMKWVGEHVNEIKKEMAELVRLMDTDWDDVKLFGKTLFTEILTKDDFTPEAIVALCDSVRPDVQQFGCNLVTRYFEETQGYEYLTKLSEHPASNLQLFATNYLTRYATGDVNRIRDLTGYFMAVLSSVNKARAAKDRIYSFFKTEIIASREIALVIADIVTRISITCAVGDKANCIEVLRDILGYYPDIKVPITIQGWDVRKGVNHGV